MEVRDVGFGAVVIAIRPVFFNKSGRRACSNLPDRHQNWLGEVLGKGIACCNL